MITSLGTGRDPVAELPMLNPEVQGSGSEVGGGMEDELVGCIVMLSLWCDDQLTCFGAICTRSRTTYSTSTTRHQPADHPAQPHRSLRPSIPGKRSGSGRCLPLTTRESKAQDMTCDGSGLAALPSAIERVHRYAQARDCDG
jgi:hypothetical protein